MEDSRHRPSAFDIFAVLPEEHSHVLAHVSQVLIFLPGEVGRQSGRRSFAEVLPYAFLQERLWGKYKVSRVMKKGSLTNERECTLQLTRLEGCVVQEGVRADYLLHARLLQCLHLRVEVALNLRRAITIPVDAADDKRKKRVPGSSHQAERRSQPQIREPGIRPRGCRCEGRPAGLPPERGSRRPRSRVARGRL